MTPYLEGESKARFDRWHEGLVARFTRELSYQEIRKGVQSLSASYVARRGRLGEGSAFDGEGKRAAFALFFAPLHFLAAYHAVREIDFHRIPAARIWDLGCGTGAAGAAWAVAMQEARGACGASESAAGPAEAAGAATPDGEAPQRGAKILGVDRSGFALGEARETYRALGVAGETRRMDLTREIPRGKGAALLAYTLNELPDRAREQMLSHLRSAAFRPLLVLEPVARRVAPWWTRWERALGQEALAVHAFEWRRRLELPDWIAGMDRAAGLDHAEMTARVLGFVG